MSAKENIGIIPSGVADAQGNLTRRDEMVNAKEFDAGNAVTTRSLKCSNRPMPGPCLTPGPCLIPPKCPFPRPRPNVR